MKIDKKKEIGNTTDYQTWIVRTILKGPTTVKHLKGPTENGRLGYDRNRQQHMNLLRFIDSKGPSPSTHLVCTYAGCHVIE